MLPYLTFHLFLGMLSNPFVENYLFKTMIKTQKWKYITDHLKLQWLVNSLKIDNQFLSFPSSKQAIWRHHLLFFKF